MAIFGSSWIEEDTFEEKYEKITGNDFIGDASDLRKEVRRKIENSWTSRSERIALRDLESDMINENKQN